MKVSLVVAGLVWPVLAFGQQAYTNADLEKFNVPGAYTNEDLRRLPPLVVQKRAAAPGPQLVTPPTMISPYQDSYDSLSASRDAFAYELEFEMQRVEFSESPFAGDAQSIQPRLGYRTQAAPLVLELQKRIAILEHQMDNVADQARRAGWPVDPR